MSGMELGVFFWPTSFLVCLCPFYEDGLKLFLLSLNFMIYFRWKK